MSNARHRFEDELNEFAYAIPCGIASGGNCAELGPAATAFEARLEELLLLLESENLDDNDNVPDNNRVDPYNMLPFSTFSTSVAGVRVDLDVTHVKISYWRGAITLAPGLAFAACLPTT